MKFLFATLSASLLIPLMSPACHAEGVIKCTSTIGVMYQATPCAEDSASTVVVAPPMVNNAAPKLGPVAGPMPPAMSTSMQPNPVTPVPAQNTEGALLVKRQKLSAGMSDMQVLNLRQWGKPQRITRNRELRAWHETWNYETGENSGTQLHFINGRLAEIADPETISPPVNTVSVAVVADQ